MPHPTPPNPTPGTAGQDNTHPASTHQPKQAATQTPNQHPPTSRNTPTTIRATKHRKTTQDQTHTHTHTHTHTPHPTPHTQTTPTRTLTRTLTRTEQKQQEHKTRKTRNTRQETNRTNPKQQHTHPQTHKPTNPQTHEPNTPTNKTPQQDQHTTTHQEQNKRTEHTKINTHHQTTKHKIKRLQKQGPGVGVQPHGTARLVGSLSAERHCGSWSLLGW